nr:hypothetical protein [Methylomarinum sp. Ch1-1]MDP4520439.1 hypothetical protein [Methylomarinum sp. Ch1-1]
MKRIKTGALPIASTPYPTLPAPVGRIKRSGSANVGRLREASRQKPSPEAKLGSLWYPGALPGGESPYGCMPM